MIYCDKQKMIYEKYYVPFSGARNDEKKEIRSCIVVFRTRY